MREERTSKKEDTDTKEVQVKYEKPLFEEQETLNFPEEIWGEFNGGKFQQTCSRCHHCR